MKPNRRFDYFSILILSSLFWLFWVQGLNFPFVYDDHWTILKNPAIREIFPLHRFFMDADTASLFPHMNKTLYRPLSTFMFSLNYGLSGLAPGPFRLVNLGLHFGSGLFLFALLRRRLSIYGWGALLALAVFWFHPAQVETVQWVNQRSNLLCIFFGFAALYCLSASDSIRQIWFIGPIFFLLSLLSKELAVVIPVLLLLVDSNPRENKKIYFLLFGMAVAYLAFRYHILGQFAQRDPRGGSYWVNFWIGRAAFWEYVRIFVFPLKLALSYRQPFDNPFNTLWPFLGGGVEFSLVGAGLIGWWKFEKKWVRPLLWMYLGLVPILGFVPADTFVAERFVYLSVAGFGWFLGWGLNSLPRRVQCLLFISILVLLIGRSYFRVQDYKSEINLWEKEIQTDSENPFAHSALAQVYSWNGQMQPALIHYQAALENRPDTKVAFGSMVNMGIIHLKLGQPQLALDWIEKAAEINPAHPSVIQNRIRAERLIEIQSKK